MIKRYVNLFNFIRELPTLNNCLIIFSPSVEWQLTLLRTEQYKNLKNKIKKQNIKIVFEKETMGVKEYEKNKSI